jgi:hypothetical protein
MSAKPAPKPTPGTKAKEAAKAAKQERRAAAKQRRAQFLEAFTMLLREDKALLPLMIAVFLVITGVGFAVGLLFHKQWMALPLAVTLGGLGAILIFNRRAQRTVFTKAEGQPGAAAGVLENLGGGWKVTPAVEYTKHWDTVHRVIGRPGVVLVAEGDPQRLGPLLGRAKRQVSPLIGDIPIYDVTVGNDEGQIPLAKLPRHLAKLPRNISKEQIDGLESRLTILAARGAAMPKGPLPPGAKMRNVQRAARRR